MLPFAWDRPTYEVWDGERPIDQIDLVLLVWDLAGKKLSYVNIRVSTSFVPRGRDLDVHGQAYEEDRPARAPPWARGG